MVRRRAQTPDSRRAVRAEMGCNGVEREVGCGVMGCGGMGWGGMGWDGVGWRSEWGGWDGNGVGVRWDGDGCGIRWR